MNILKTNTLSTSTNKDVVTANCTDVFEIENNFIIEEITKEVIIESTNEIIEVATYEQMYSMLPANFNIDFLVLQDEDKSIENTTYKYFTSSNSLMWIASIKEEL